MSHLGGAYPGGDTHTWMPDIWGWLLVTYDIRTVLDLGTGYGHNLSWFQSMGCRVMGVEGDPAAVEGSVLPSTNIFCHDFTEKPLILDRNYDLCMALEFVEHVDEKYMDNWMSAVRACTFFLMSFATPGQGGHHHVNENTQEYWDDQMRKRGFNKLIHETLLFRKTLERKPSPWGRKTVTFYSNRGYD